MEQMIYMHSFFLFQEMVDAYKSTKDKWRAFSYEKAIIAIKVWAKQSSEWTKNLQRRNSHQSQWTKVDYEVRVYICGVS